MRMTSELRGRTFYKNYRFGTPWLKIAPPLVSQL